MTKATGCSVPDCDRKHFCGGFCNPHYQRLVRWGDVRSDVPIKRVRPSGHICSIEGCGRPHVANGWCEAHNLRWQKTGDVRPDVPIRGRMTRKGPCTVDGCGKPREARGLCIGHMLREDKFGDVRADIPLKQRSDGACSVTGCPLPHAGLGWCRAHYEPFKLYKLTPDDYDALLAKQGGVCAICGVVPILDERLRVDHDHACCPARSRSCGKCVRGLLCSLCNLMIGYANDDTRRLHRAIEYLDESRRARTAVRSQDEHAVA